MFANIVKVDLTCFLKDWIISSSSKKNRLPLRYSLIVQYDKWICRYFFCIITFMEFRLIICDCVWYEWFLLLICLEFEQHRRGELEIRCYQTKLQWLQMLKITLKARLSLNNYIHIWCPKGKYILKSFKFINDYYIINNFDSKITKYIARAPTTTTALPKLANLNTLRTPPFSLEKILDETSIKTFPVIQKYVFSRLQILQGSISLDSSYRVI